MSNDVTSVSSACIAGVSGLLDGTYSAGKRGARAIQDAANVIVDAVEFVFVFSLLVLIVVGFPASLIILGFPTVLILPFS